MQQFAPVLIYRTCKSKAKCWLLEKCTWDPPTSLLDKLPSQHSHWAAGRAPHAAEHFRGVANILFLNKTYFPQLSESFSVLSVELVIKKPLNIILKASPTPPLAKNTTEYLAGSPTAHCFYYSEANGKGTAVSGWTLYKFHNKVKGLDRDVT